MDFSSVQWPYPKTLENFLYDFFAFAYAFLQKFTSEGPLFIFAMFPEVNTRTNKMHQNKKIFFVKRVSKKSNFEEKKSQILNKNLPTYPSLKLREGWQQTNLCLRVALVSISEI